MSSPDFHIYAGREALNHIRNNGLKPDDISMMLGASSGPKWLVLHGFDRYWLNQFPDQRSQPLHLLGTSAGAWRMSCYAQNDSVAAHDRLTESYIEQAYSERPSGEEIITTCREMINTVLGSEGADEILNHAYTRFHLITTQCHGLAASQKRVVQGGAFLTAGLLNMISRQLLNLQFTRVVMHHPDNKPPLTDISGLRSRFQALSAEGMNEAILSTGCIPVLINGVKDVAGPGLYQDGGITDYGFDLPFLPETGFVLYPHFSKRPAPGWFDKQLPWRKPDPENYSRTVMLVPKDSFVQSLPFGKIPDRNDFRNMDDNTRKRYWREVVSRTEIFGEQLQDMNWAAHAEELPWI